jgi:hypothetical protein
MLRTILIVVLTLSMHSVVLAQSDLAPLNVTTNIAPVPGYLLLAQNCRITPRPFGSYLGAYGVNGNVLQTGKTTNDPFEFNVLPDGRLAYSKLVVFAGASVPDGVYVVDTLFNTVDSIKQQRDEYLTTQHDIQMLPNGHRLVLGPEDVTIDMSKVVPCGHPAANVVQAIIQELDADGNVVAPIKDSVPAA